MAYSSENSLRSTVQAYLQRIDRGRLYHTMNNYAVECKHHRGVWIPVYSPTVDGSVYDVFNAIHEAFDRCEGCKATQEEAASWANTRWPAGAEL